MPSRVSMFLLAFPNTNCLSKLFLKSYRTNCLLSRK